MGIVYALFDSAQAAEPTLQELSRNCEEHQAFAVQVHDRSRSRPTTSQKLRLNRVEIS